MISLKYNAHCITYWPFPWLWHVLDVEKELVVEGSALIKI